MQQYLIFNNENEANNALSAINLSMGFPDITGTTTWDVVEKAHEQNVWFFTLPEGMQASNTTTNVSQYRKPIENLEFL